MRIMSRWLVAVLVASLVPCLTAGRGYAEVVDRIVAEVNDDIITLSELESMVKAMQAQAGTKPTGKESKEMQRQMLQALIDRKLAKAEAKRRGMQLSDKEVDQALQRFKAKNNIPNDEELARGLSQAGLTVKEFRQQLADQIMQERLMAVAVQNKPNISDSDVRRIYEEGKLKEKGTQVHLRSITLPYPPGATEAQKEETKKQAEAIMEAVRKGGSFSEVAKKFGVTDTDLGFVNQNDLDPRLADYLNKLKPKEVAPVQANEGFQLFQLVDRRVGAGISFEEAAPEIRRMLMAREMEKQFGEWVKTLREKAHIKIML